MNINIVKTYGVALTAFCICSCSVNTQTQKNEYIVPGEVWNDTEGNPVNAHGGGILYHDGTYYWYGEYRKDSPSRLGYLVVLSYGCNRCQLLLFHGFAELEIRGHCASCRKG